MVNTRKVKTAKEKLQDLKTRADYMLEILPMSYRLKFTSVFKYINELEKIAIKKNCLEGVAL